MTTADRIIAAARRVIAEKYDKDDGDMCWIVHSDIISELEDAIEDYDRWRENLMRARKSDGTSP